MYICIYIYIYIYIYVYIYIYNNFELLIQRDIFFFRNAVFVEAMKKEICTKLTQINRNSIM